MSKPGPQPDALGRWLEWIDFPGMKIKDSLLTIEPVHTRHRPTGEAIGEQPEPPSTTAVDIAASQHHGGYGYLK